MPTKQKSGLYRTKIVIGHDPETGLAIVKWVSGRTKKELEAKKKTIVDLYINGDLSAASVNFGDYVQKWYAVRKKPYIRQGSRKMYESIINSRLLPVFRNRPLHTIGSMDVQAYLNTLTDLSIGRVKSIRMVFHGIMQDALRDGLIRANPVSTTRINGTPPKDRHVLTRDERETIETVCRTHPDGLLLAMLYYTGMRLGESLAVRWQDISLPDRVLRVTGSIKWDDSLYRGSTKTKSSVRSIPIPPPLHALLSAVPESERRDTVIHGPITGRAIGPSQLRKRWSRLMQACNLGTTDPETGTFTPMFMPHTLRHNYTTMLYENGVDPYTASRLLGHSSIKTTMDIYAHFSTPAMESARSQLDNIFRQ